MNIKIKVDDEWVVLFNVELSGNNKKRIRFLDNSEMGKQVITQCAINHKLGIMDMNKALDVLWENEELPYQ